MHSLDGAALCTCHGGVRRSLTRHEQAERVSGRVEHDSETVTITIRWLPRRFGPTPGEHECNRSVDVGDQDLQVQLLL